MSPEEPLYQHIASTIRTRIEDGTYAERLPIEIMLAEHFEASVPTVKKALALLVDEGLIKRIPGKGTFVVSASRLERTSISSAVGGLEQTGSTNDGNSNKPLVVGLVVPAMNTVSTDGLIAGVATGLSHHGAHPLLGLSAGSQQQESVIIDNFIRAGVDGLIVFPVEGELYNEDIVRLSLARFPLVLVDRWLPGIDVSRVVSDHARGVEQAVDYLHQLGHRHMALVSVASDYPESTQSILERQAGFLSAIRLHGLNETSALWIKARTAETTNEDVIHYLESMLSEHQSVTALIGMSATDTMLIIAATKRLGLSVPGDLSVVGFDVGSHTSEMDRIIYGDKECHAITWLDQSVNKIGIEAADLIHRLICGSGRTEVIEIPITLRQGKSTDKPPLVR